MDPSTEFSKVCAELVKDFAKELVTETYDKGKEELEKLSVTFGLAFKKYLQRAERKHSKIKTLLDPSTPVLLMSVFEAPDFEQQNDSFISSEDFIQFLSKNTFCIIQGFGGSGKSVYLKYLFLKFCKHNYHRIPIFLELRQIKKNETILLTLLDHLNLKADLHSVGFEHALKTGKFLLLFDGFDEIAEERREEIAEEIKQISFQYEKNIILVSSRPRDDFSAWNEFYSFKICEFSEQQVVSLIEKLKYEGGAKKTFVENIPSLYQSHKSYLSNPLLCIIMLMTSDQGAGTPEKRHLFFDLAFDVLFYKHDAMKGGYFKRLFLTGLPIDAFKDAFGSFSAFSYHGIGSSFMRNDALSYAQRAIDYDNTNKLPTDFLDDLSNRMCLLIREGSRYSFIHRTFQEYFTAYFLAYRAIDHWGEIVHQIVMDHANDTVIPMLYEMAPARFEQQYVLPKIKQLQNEISQAKNERDFCELFYLGVDVVIDSSLHTINSWTIGNNLKFSKYHFLDRILSEDILVKKVLVKPRRDQWSTYFSQNPNSQTKGDLVYELDFAEMNLSLLAVCPAYFLFKDLEQAYASIAERIEADVLRKDKLVSEIWSKKLARRLSAAPTSPAS